MSKELPVKVILDREGRIRDVTVGGHGLAAAIPQGQATFQAARTPNEDSVIDLLLPVDEVVIVDA